MADLQEAHPEVRLIELRSREVYELDENNVWKEVSRDELVTDQFNKWAQDNDINPVGTPSITMHQTYQQIGDNKSRAITTYTLCASVMTRRNQWLSELSYRAQVDRVVRTVAANPTVANDGDSPAADTVGTTSIPPGGKLEVTQVSLPTAPPPPSAGSA